MKTAGHFFAFDLKKRKRASAFRTMWILLLLALPEVCVARQIPVSFWVSGGAEGILDGGRVAPGWLGLLTQLGNRPAEEPWIDVGGTRHLDSLREIKDLRLPEASVPGQSFMRIKGVTGLQHISAPWVITNAGWLPQFPDAVLPVESEWKWTHPDGGKIRLHAAWDDQLPLSVPFNRLRPLRVYPSMDSIRSVYLNPSPALEVLVIPEDAHGPDWSKAFPDADVIIEPAGGAPQVIEVADGNRIRVRPGMYGRSVIRVWARWDTVSKTFSPPNAEIVWVSECDYTNLDLPDDIIHSIRTLESPDVLTDVDVLWMPEFNSLKTETLRPDGIRAQRVPHDDAWFVANVPPSLWSEWKSVSEQRWKSVRTSQTRSPRVLLPASVLAGRGDWNCPIRQAFLKGKVTGSWLESTTRDLVNLEQMITGK